MLDQAHVIVGELQAEMLGDVDPAELAICVKVLNELAAKLER